MLYKEITNNTEDFSVKIHSGAGCNCCRDVSAISATPSATIVDVSATPSATIVDRRQWMNIEPIDQKFENINEAKMYMEEELPHFKFTRSAIGKN